ncbi:MAG: helix-turn-helix transcriptional regulator [Kutzneria sp.]|nr:helix-turn-helix transcriptional regulator [Kutzneria sp.]
MTIAAGHPDLSYADTVPADRNELVGLLATGPFPDALRAAIKTSRLSLDRIQHRLGLRGITISVATLSYWQSGRRRPERPESLEALRHLEAVLGVPPGALTALLGPPRPRGRRSRPSRMLPMDALWTRRERLANLLSRVDTSSDSKLGRLSQHDRIEVAADGGQRSLWVRQVLRADQDGADRWVLVFDSESTPGTIPELGSLRNCRVGRTAVDSEASILVAELVFDRTLARGDTVVMEYQLTHPNPPYPASGDGYCRKFRLPVREYVVEVRFAPSRLPVRCQQYAVPAGEEGPSRRRNLALDPAGGVHAVALGFGPGMFGVRWDWPTN